MEYPSYAGAMKAAGAKVLAFEAFGSYQGDWWAKVSYNGQEGWVNGSYGSCSGCDALQAEFDYGSRDRCNEHCYTYVESIIDACPACKVAQEAYMQRYAKFGKSYLDGIMPQEQAVEYASRNLTWDSDAPAMVKFIESNAGPAEEFEDVIVC